MKEILVILIMSLCCPYVACAQAPVVLSDEFPYLAEVQSENVKVRAGQSTNFEELGLLQKGEQVVVTGQSYSWLKIKLPVSADAYVSAKYIKDLGRNTGESTASRLNVRARPDRRATVIGQLDRGQLVHVLERKPEWLKIEPVDRNTGWVLGEFLQYKSGQIPSPRVVQKPTRNIYRKTESRKTAKVLTEPKPVEPETHVVFRGVVEDLGDKAPSRLIRHQVLNENKKVYYLFGYRQVIDGFLNQKVRIEGEIQPEKKAEHPVVLVKKIELIL